jgi:hypothetical protein
VVEAALQTGTRSFSGVLRRELGRVRHVWCVQKSSTINDLPFSSIVHGGVEANVGHEVIPAALEAGRDDLGRRLLDAVVVEDEPVLRLDIAAHEGDVVPRIRAAPLVDHL